MAPVRSEKVNPLPEVVQEQDADAVERRAERWSIVLGAVLGIAIVVMVALAVAAVAQVAGGPW